MNAAELTRERESADDAVDRLEKGSDYPRVDADEVRRMFATFEKEIARLREFERAAR